MKFLFSFLLLAQCQLSFAQTPADTTVSLNAGEYALSYWHNGIRLVSEPIRWKKKNWIMFGATAAITAGLTTVDADINKPFKRWYDNNADFGKAGGFAGSVPVMVGGGLVTFGIAKIIKNRNLQNFAMDNLQAQIFTGGLTFVTKYAFGRARPNDLRGANYWDGPIKANNFQSFFSGHSSLAFSTATMVFLHSHKKPWVGVASYGIASAISISRMQNQKHWASDVFLGAVTGWAVSNFVYQQNEKQRAAKKLKMVL